MPFTYFRYKSFEHWNIQIKKYKILNILFNATGFTTMCLLYDKCDEVSLRNKISLQSVDFSDVSLRKIFILKKNKYFFVETKFIKIENISLKILIPQIIYTHTNIYIF